MFLILFRFILELTVCTLLQIYFIIRNHVSLMCLTMMKCVRGFSMPYIRYIIMIKCTKLLAENIVNL